MKKMLIVMLLAGCAKSTPASESPQPEQLPPPQGQTAPECVDDKGEVVECNSDDDCCKGFACASDPEGSIRTRVCLFAG